MSDTTLNRFNASGTTTQRLAFTPSPPTPASGPSVGYLWFDTTLQAMFAWNVGTLAWVSAAGVGTVTTTGSPASGNLTKFSGTTAVTNGDLSGDISTSGTLATTIGANKVVNSMFATMAQSTMKGRAAGAGTGTTTDLTATQATAILDAVVGDSGSGGTKGLVPAPASGDAAAGKFLKADGTFAVPPGSSGGFGLLEQHTASSSASLDFTTAITSTYDVYEFVLENLVPAAGTPNLVMTFSTDGGSTWLSSAYAGGLTYVNNSGSTGTNNGVTANIRLNENYASTTAASGGVNGTARLTNPLSASAAKFVTFQTININGSDGALYTSTGGGWNSGTTAVNAVRFQFADAGGTLRNIASGTIRVYGLAK